MSRYPNPYRHESLYREAVILSVDRVLGVANVRDMLGQRHEVELRFQRARLPLVGERWVMGREFGPWTLLCPIQPETNVSSPRKFVTSVGDGGVADIVVTHNFGTRDVVVTVYDSTTFAVVPIESDELHPDGPAETDTHSQKYHSGAVLSGITHTTENTVTLHFLSAPAIDAYRVVVLG